MNHKKQGIHSSCNRSAPYDTTLKSITIEIRNDTPLVAYQRTFNFF
jgi:hypothetical protein